MNANPVLTYNQTYSPTSTTWLTPTSVQPDDMRPAFELHDKNRSLARTGER